jgi:hypothetical protein
MLSPHILISQTCLDTASTVRQETNCHRFGIQGRVDFAGCCLKQTTTEKYYFLEKYPETATITHFVIDGGLVFIQTT